MTTLSPELIKRLKTNKDFEIYQEYVLEKVGDIESLYTLGDLNAADISVEVKARARALKILEEILSPVIEFKEKPEPTEEEIKEAEDKYGL